MAYGLIVTNSNDVYQIDGVNRNYGVSLTRTSVNHWDYDGIGILGFSAPNSTDGEIVLFRGTSGYKYGYMNYKEFSTSELFLLQQNGSNVEGTQTVEFIKIAPNAATYASTGYGLEVFDDNGLKIFTTEQRIFNIDATLTLTPTATNTVFNFTFPTPEFGLRYFQMYIHGGTGEFGADAGMYITRTGETSATIEFPSALVDNYYFGNLVTPINVTILTGYLQ